MHLKARTAPRPRDTHEAGDFFHQKKDTAAPKAAPAAPTPAPAPALKKVSLAGFATQTPASKSAKAYPLLPDPDRQVAEIVTSILDRSAQVEALEGALELECVALKRLHNCVAERIPHGRRSGKRPS